MKNRLIADIAFTKSGYPFVNDGSRVAITESELSEAEDILSSVRSLVKSSPRPDAIPFDPERMASRRRIEDLGIEMGRLDSEMRGLPLYTPTYQALMEKKNAIASEIQGIRSQLAGSDKS